MARVGTTSITKRRARATRRSGDKVHVDKSVHATAPRLMRCRGIAGSNIVGIAASVPVSALHVRSRDVLGACVVPDEKASHAAMSEKPDLRWVH